MEDPAFADNAPHYALHVTYWKDSVVSDRIGGRVAYPVAYSLIQAQYAKAIRRYRQANRLNTAFVTV